MTYMLFEGNWLLLCKITCLFIVFPCNQNSEVCASSAFCILSVRHFMFSDGHYSYFRCVN